MISGPLPRSDTRDNVSVTVLFLSSSLSYVGPRARGFISPVAVPDALLDLSKVGVFKGVTPDKRLDLLTGVAGVVVDVSARSLSSGVIAVLLTFGDALELLGSDTIDMGTVDALLVSDSWPDVSILETSERVEIFFSCLGVVTFLLGLPLFLLLSEGASSVSCEASSATLSSLSDAKGSVEAMLEGDSSSVDAVLADFGSAEATLLGLPGIAVSAVKSFV